MKVSIRTESPADGPAVQRILKASFPTDAEAKLVDKLRERGKAVISLVAELGGAVAGHILFSPVQIGNVPGLGLAPVAVMPEYQRKRIGSRLIEAGLEVCRQSGTGFVLVLGEPEFYAKFGFESAAARGIRNEYGAGDEFQVLELRRGGLPEGGGMAKYAPEFVDVVPE